MTEINWEEMEGLFCQQANDKGSTKVGKDSGSVNVERKVKKDNEVRFMRKILCRIVFLLISSVFHRLFSWMEKEALTSIFSSNNFVKQMRK